MAGVHDEVTHRNFSNSRNVTQSKEVDLISEFHQVNVQKVSLK